MSGSTLILLFGVLTYSLVIFNVLTGKRIIKMNLKYHRVTGQITLLCATVHLGIVLYYKLFV